MSLTVACVLSHRLEATQKQVDARKEEHRRETAAGKEAKADRKAVRIQRQTELHFVSTQAILTTVRFWGCL